jgi:hypothetical protein
MLCILSLPISGRGARAGRRARTTIFEKRVFGMKREEYFFRLGPFDVNAGARRGAIRATGGLGS